MTSDSNFAFLKKKEITQKWMNTKHNHMNMRVGRWGTGPLETYFMFQHEQSYWAWVSDIIRAFKQQIEKSHLKTNVK